MESLTNNPTAMTCLKVGGLVVGLGVLWYLTSERKGGRGGALSRDSLVQVLKELSRELHSVLTEVAQICVNIDKSLRAKNLQKSLSQEQLEGLLMQQGIQERLEEASRRVYERHNTDELSVASAGKKFEKDGEVKDLEDGLRTMYKDALSGTLPVMPGLTLPEGLTPASAMRVSIELQAEKLQRFQDVFKSLPQEERKGGASHAPNPQLTQLLIKAAEAAETAVMERNSKLLEAGGLPTWQSAVALFSKDDEWREKKAKMDELHQQRVVRMMREARGEEGGEAVSVGGNAGVVGPLSLDPKLQQTLAEELPLRLKSCEDAQTTTVVLVTRRNNTSAFKQNLEAYNKKIAKYCEPEPTGKGGGRNGCHGSEDELPTFLWMADDDGRLCAFCDEILTWSRNEEKEKNGRRPEKEKGGESDSASSSCRLFVFPPKPSQAPLCGPLSSFDTLVAEARRQEERGQGQGRTEQGGREKGKKEKEKERDPERPVSAGSLSRSSDGEICA
uniref:Transmembrane protein n=1 Tax=Chromera velia CCMP2878 TaxID=1169474 RepID=A0A0G4HQC3_9ALVE|mmetsp:Transcript_31273/g.61746  ORF Transcript_31273/g.61746 Transcript_31273/m.61746 type:complete len:502 (-) Transcript_31273:849-2354(-)|eukprot:Cvel_7924.t1-p1 / transcript=Cvel_7924.t1 / gene=Cvel_7924 / organism=Chromera_velia_CCMP2878 / gene_product=hypothetical protein / transcript_product=hypothetical protein / location=Cvel_scaffold425:1090-9049(-) / protein_length=501 / sequence_SO=supercontig / SO=protein_coding / is_pseudo=false